MSTDTKPRPIRIAGAVVNTINGIAAGLGGVSLLEGNETIALIAALVVLVTSVVSQSLIPVLEGKVVPVGDVATYLDADRQVVDGPAAGEVWESFETGKDFITDEFVNELDSQVSRRPIAAQTSGRHYDLDGDGVADHAQS